MSLAELLQWAAVALIVAAAVAYAVAGLLRRLRKPAQGCKECPGCGGRRRGDCCHNPQPTTTFPQDPTC